MKSTSLKVFFVLAFVTFFVGDLATTFVALEAGHRESNPLLATVGYLGTVIAKILFFVFAYWIIGNIESKGYASSSGFVLGCIFAIGLLTVIINSGVFYR